MNHTYYTLFITLIVLGGCNRSNEKLFSELERFDNSLDSLIIEETYNARGYLIFQGDTLKNNPKAIEETYYQIIDNDSLKVDANCHFYQFDKSHLLLNSTEDFLGKKFVQKFIYFTDKIDNKKMAELRETRSDTIYFGRLRKYNKKGLLIKSIESYESKALQKDGSIIVNDYRLLDVYQYRSDTSYTIWRKEYFNKKYHVDSLRNAKTKVLPFTNRPTAWEADKINYSYKLDEHGNWIVKRKKGANPDVIYRKYTY